MMSWPETEDDFKNARGKLLDDEGHACTLGPGELPGLILAGPWGHPRVKPGAQQVKCSTCEALLAIDTQSQEFLKRDPQLTVLCPECAIDLQELQKVIELARKGRL